MTSKEKKIIFTIIGVMVVIMLIAILVKVGKGNKKDVGEANNISSPSAVQGSGNQEEYTTELIDGSKLNTSRDFYSTKTYKTVEVTGTQYTTSANGNSQLIANVKNTGNTKFAREVVTITILGDNGEAIDTVTAVIPELEAGETKTLSATATADLTNVKDYTIQAKHSTAI